MMPALFGGRPPAARLPVEAPRRVSGFGSNGSVTPDGASDLRVGLHVRWVAVPPARSGPPAGAPTARPDQTARLATLRCTTGIPAGRQPRNKHGVTARFSAETLEPPVVNRRPSKAMAWGIPDKVFPGPSTNADLAATAARMPALGDTQMPRFLAGPLPPLFKHHEAPHAAQPDLAR